MNGIKSLTFTLLMTVCTVCSAEAADITYTRADSLKVVSLLKEGMKQKSGTNLMLYYGKKLQGIPYVAHTLEVNNKEKLVINMREMDCTTFVETVFALALTTKDKSFKWQDYCRNLERIRYNEGLCNGYASRNHYFLWWTESNEKQRLVTLPMQELLKRSNVASYPYARKQYININYMSTHSAAYKMLKGDKVAIKAVSTHERASQGKVMMYIPADRVGLSSSQLKYIKDGDIIAIATKKKGLDTSHIGIASWGKDKKLHLLNASQIHKKVILEPKTMKQYMSEHPSQLGIWVIRPNL